MTTSVITAWETFSPLGHGAEAHVAGLFSGEGVRDAVEGFDVRAILGKKGTRAMDRTAGLAVATTGRLLDKIGRDRYAADDLGLVLGTNDGVQSVMDFLRDTWTRDKPYDVDPAHVPRTLMNFAAGQCAIWYGIKGPNTTICGSHATGLLTLNYARRMRGNGHAKAAVWGVVEELSAGRKAVEAARSAEPNPSEGCVMFLLEAPEAVGEDRRALAEILAVDFGVYHEPDELTQALGACLRRALRRAGADAGQVAAVVPASSLSRGARERAAVAEVLPDAPVRTKTAERLGDTGAASAAYQIVELLAEPGEPGRIGVVTTSDAEGRVGCAVLRIC
ncbi:beta-ketoacyl synthase N-terminal-like domain-containing protein [Amycolatopsis sp. NPDC005003]